MKKLRFIAAFGVVLAALCLAGFTDLPEDHWASGAVTQLSQEGTVSGMPDGTFRPNNPVTRAQFVKMLGYSSAQLRTDYISDLSQTHWAYDYLVHSPLRLSGREILPDKPMTREEAALYIYDCYAKGAAANAPSVITKGLDHPTEVGWVYDRGIMVGSDGLDLRLDSVLTRAEAAVLIVNARQKLNSTADFADIISDGVLRRIFNSSALFDVDYDPAAVLTNGQVARAACRLRLDCVDALWYYEDADFEHPYANDLKAMETVLGPGRISSNFADAPAMPEDAFAMIAYGVASKIHIPVGYGMAGDTYADAKPADPSLSPALTFAYENGIRPYGGGLLKSGLPVTHKAMAAVLLQYDRLWGLRTSLTVDGSSTAYRDEPIRTANVPAAAEVYQSVPASVPTDAAELPFVDLDGNEITPGVEPKVNFAFCNDLRDAFANTLNAICAQVREETGAALTLTYYPQLVYDCGEGMTLRLRVESDADAAELFPGHRTYRASDGSDWVEISLSYSFFME